MHPVIAEKIQDFFDEGILSVFERDGAHQLTAECCSSEAWNTVAKTA